jgi:2-phosphosulfolactate phosphatase
MTIDVLWTPLELEGAPIQEGTAVLVDVLRAATSIAAAIHNGARSVVPASSTEEALRIANSIGRREALLCGERRGLRIEGFDLGNSPAEFSPETVKGRTVVMTTTNGTQVLAAMAAAREVYIAGLVNLGAVAARLADLDGDVLIVCAGREGRVSAEDALCAGLLVEACLARGPRARRGKRRRASEVELGDGAVAVLALAKQHTPVAAEFLRRTAAGRALERIGHADDIERCARIDSIPVLPVFSDRRIVAGRSDRSGDGVRTGTA